MVARRKQDYVLTLFKAGFSIAVALMGINTYIGWSAAANYVERAQYNIDRGDDKSDARLIDQKIDKILKSVQATEKSIAVMQAEEALRREFRQSNHNSQGEIVIVE